MWNCVLYLEMSLCKSVVLQKSGLMRYTRSQMPGGEVSKSTKRGVLPKCRSQHSDMEPKFIKFLKRK